MIALLVDTDVVSYVFKRDTRSVLYEPHLSGNSLFISFMTVAELEWWATVRGWGGRRRQELEYYLHKYTVIDSDRALCQQWAATRYQAQEAGREIAPADAWIAATATLYQIPLVTHNRSDFSWLHNLNLISEAP